MKVKKKSYYKYNERENVYTIYSLLHRYYDKVFFQIQHCLIIQFERILNTFD